MYDITIVFRVFELNNIYVLYPWYKYIFEMQIKKVFYISICLH